MNWLRLLTGILLSFVFLALFAHLFSGINLFLGSFSNNFSEAAIGDISGANALEIYAPQPFEISEPAGPSYSDSAIQALEVDAKAAMSVESNLRGFNKIIFEQNAYAPFPIASLTKLMTAVVALDNYRLTDIAVVTQNADAQDAIKGDVKLNDAFPVESLMHIMLMASSNKSAYALAELMGVEEFVQLMNYKARELGLEDTFFSDPTGLSPQNVSSARDVVRLLEYILKNRPEIGRITRVKSFYVAGFGEVFNTDELLNEFPEIVCGKTGFTVEANGCLVVVTENAKNKDYLISVILGANDRFAEMKKLINWSRTACELTN